MADQLGWPLDACPGTRRRISTTHRRNDGSAPTPVRRGPTDLGVLVVEQGPKGSGWAATAVRTSAASLPQAWRLSASMPNIQTNSSRLFAAATASSTVAIGQSRSGDPALQNRRPRGLSTVETILVAPPTITSLRQTLTQRLSHARASGVAAA